MNTCLLDMDMDIDIDEDFVAKENSVWARVLQHPSDLL